MLGKHSLKTFYICVGETRIIYLNIKWPWIRYCTVKAEQMESGNTFLTAEGDAIASLPTKRIFLPTTRLECPSHNHKQ